MKKIRFSIAILAAISILVLPAAASANSGQQGYSGPNSAVSGVTSSGGNGPSSGSPSPAVETAPVVEEAPTVAAAEVESSGSTLPFTGLDVGVIALAGVVLLGMGFLLRRYTHRAPTA
jgi:hypothetical protein